MNTVIVDIEGNLIKDEGNLNIESNDDFVKKEVFKSLPLETTTEYDDLLLRKVSSGSGQEQFTIFFRRS